MIEEIVKMEEQDLATHYGEYITKLEKLHHALDKKIRGRVSTGVYDEYELKLLKKEKLQLRDEIELLKRKQFEHVHGQTQHDEQQ